MNDTTDTETSADLRDLVERATAAIVEVRRASSGGVTLDVHDADIAEAVPALEPDAKIEHFAASFERPEFWVIETTEWRCFTRRRPAGK